MKVLDTHASGSSDTMLNTPLNQKSLFINILERLPKGIGKDYLNGKVTTSHDDVAHLVYNALCALPMAEREILAIYKEFTYFQMKQHLNTAFDKPVKDVVIPIPMEKNLLRNHNFSAADYARKNLRKSIATLCQKTEITAIQALGIFLANLMLESGVITAADQISILRSSSMGLTAIENLWFLESRNQFPNSQTVGIRRFIIDPLSICIFMVNFEKIQSLLIGISSDKDFLILIRKAFKAIYERTDGENLSVSQFRSGATLEALIRLPGFIYQRVLRKAESYDLPLHAFARSMGVYVAPPAADLATLDQDDEDDDDEAPDGLPNDGESVSGKSRVVKANIITKRQFDNFLEWINNHPSISLPERQQLEILYSLAFYCGLRRGEAKGLRLKDIYPETPIIAHLRPYPGHSLKTESAKRKVLLEWLPTSLSQAIARIAKNNRHSEQTLIEAYSKETFIASLYEKANNLIQRFFGDPALTVHSLRHSYTSLNLLKLMAGPLRMHDLSGMSCLIDDVLPEASAFTRSLVGHLNPSAKLLWSLSKSVGHIDPSTTLRSYTHVLDILTFYAYAYSRPQGYYARICEVSGISNRKLHKYLKNPRIDGDHFRYDDKISFSGRVPFPLLKQLEQKYPGAVTRLTGSFSGNNPYISDGWTKLTELFTSARTASIPLGFSDIYDDETTEFIRNFSPSDADMKALLSLQKRIPPDRISLSLLEGLCRHFDRRYGHLAIRPGFPTRELAQLLRTQGLVAEDFILKSFGSSVLAKRTIPLTKSFTALSRIKTNAQLSYRPRHLKRVPHSAIYWYFCAILIQKSATSTG